MKPLAILATLSLLGGLSSMARAQECTDDSDCDEGYTCQVVGESSSGCDPSADGGCPEPVITQYRECEAVPLTCDTDSDCPHDLSCVEAEAGDCTVASPGPGAGGIRDRAQ